ncbi:hypothetical protein ACFQ07_24580, partial [Actinomadura adrarensis]
MMKWIAEIFVEGAMTALLMTLNWWIIEADAPTLNADPDGVLFFIREHTNWLTGLMAFAGLVIASARGAVQRRGQPFRAAFTQFFELALTVLLLATAVNLANVGADRYSMWVVGQTVPEGGWSEEIDTAFEASDSTLGAIALYTMFGVAALISSLIQFFMMAFRSGVLVVLVGILPVLAASRFSEYGNNAYRKCIGWLISYIVYKPVAATVYAAAMLFITSDYGADKIIGLTLMIGAVFVLPMVLRAVMPALENQQPNASAWGFMAWVQEKVFGSTSLNMAQGKSVFTPNGGGGPTGAVPAGARAGPLPPGGGVGGGPQQPSPGGA